MRIDSRAALALIAGAVLVLAPVAAAGQTQTTPTPEHDFTSCSIVGVLTGMSVASSDVAPTVGGMFAWPLTPRLGLEVAAAWSDRPNDGSGFAAGLTLRENLTARQALVPYVKAGAGVYVATVDRARGMPPEFYRHRLGSADGRVDVNRHTFADPAVVLGGGVSWFIGRRIALRPEVETFIVRGGSRTSVVTSVVARLEYHFEDYRVTRDTAGR